jgi:exo-1,4-beta-D-glucosaminidase
LYNMDGKEKASQQGTMDLAADAAVKAFDVPKPDGLTTTYFLRLQLHDAAGKLVSDNFYWLSTKPDTMNWKGRKDTAYTPQAEFGDLTGLNSLPQVKLEVKAATTQEHGKTAMRVSVRNPSASIAFMVHLRITKGKGGEDVVPIFWEDNYFPLFPSEQREVSATYNPSSREGKDAVLVVDGYNVSPAEIASPHP